MAPQVSDVIKTTKRDVRKYYALFAVLIITSSVLDIYIHQIFPSVIAIAIILTIYSMAADKERSALMQEFAKSLDYTYMPNAEMETVHGIPPVGHLL